MVIGEQLNWKRNQVDLLRQRVATARINLETRRKTLEAMKMSLLTTGRTTRSAPVGSGQVSPYEAVAQYARKKGFLAAAAIREGKGDQGYIRDLADAALFGSALAATVMADFALNAVTEDKERQQSEGLAWLNLAAQHDPPNDELKRRIDKLRSEMSADAILQSRLNLSLINDRRAMLVRPPSE